MKPTGIHNDLQSSLETAVKNTPISTMLHNCSKRHISNNLVIAGVACYS